MRKIVAAIIGAAIAVTAAAGCASSATGKAAPQTAAPLTAAEQRLVHDHINHPWVQISPRAFYHGDRVTSAAMGVGAAGSVPFTLPGGGPVFEEVIASATPQAASLLARQLAFTTNSLAAEGKGVINAPWQVNDGDHLTGTLIIVGSPAGMAEFNKLVLSIRPTLAP